MSLKSNFVNTPLTPSRNFAILRKGATGINDYRGWRRRRLKKSNRKLVFTVQSHLGNSTPFDEIFRNLVSAFHFSVNSLNVIAPALGFASGLALYLSRPKLKLKYRSSSQLSGIGEWILFTAPTPFNRFVMLRCPSITFEGGELLEDVNEKLVKEDRHFVRLNTGKIQLSESDLLMEEEEENRVVYQRKCVSTDDGGVISLDWPANLDLSEEHGLDSTLLLIPGTAEGSMDKNVRSFVCECLKRGCFPIVMNPRGCAGSPLTTARLFTAADSDDVSIAIQFINKVRPWTTLMGVGWGFGANMLTKYLAEAGEKTPLTAATCIDNPFDLEEVTRSSTYQLAVDQKLTGGLVDILRSNKELFQGRARQFDIEKALLATSVRDFEKAISMISYGFDTIEDFYAGSSTQGVIGNVKIPLLFIQNEDGTVPLFSIPRSSIAANPYTSLLLCSCPPGILRSGRSTLSWCQNLTIEWLTAVELGLLKGRHPLLKDVDVNINPSKGLVVVEDKALNKSAQVKKILNLPRMDNVNGHSLNYLKKMFGESNISAGLRSRTGQDSQSISEDEHEGLGQEKDETTSIAAEFVKEIEVDPVDGERGQVLQSAEVVMNMLDATIPDTLTEEQKKKVLTAVGQGETLVKALQDAVPEDVREKLTTSVSGILQSQRSNLKLDGLLNMSQISEVASGLKSKMQAKARSGSSAKDGTEDSYSSQQKKSVGDLADDSDENQPRTDKPQGDISAESRATDNSQKSINTDQLHSTSKKDTDESDHSGNKETNELESNYKETKVSKEADDQYNEHTENTTESGSNPEICISSERSSPTEDRPVDQSKEDHYGEKYLSDMKEDNIHPNEEKDSQLSRDHNKMINTEAEEKLAPSVSSSEPHLMEKESTENQKKEEEVVHPVPNQNSSTTQAFSVSQALDAFTGIDDSTQAAVNSVFNVIEDMITHLEEGRDDGTKVDDGKKTEDLGTDSVSENHQSSNDIKVGQSIDDQNDSSLQSEKLSDVASCSQMNSNGDPSADWVDEKTQHKADVPGSNNIYMSREIELGHHVREDNGKGENLIGSSNLSPVSSKKVLSVEKAPHDIPRYITRIADVDPLYKDYLRKYLVSNVNTKSLDLDTTAALFLDYFPEEGQWKLLEQTGYGKDTTDDATNPGGDGENVQIHIYHEDVADEIIEPSYVILDSEKQQEPVREYEMVSTMNEKAEVNDATSEELMLSIKNVVLDALMAEVSRRLSSADIKEMEQNLASDLEHVANAVTLAHVKGRIQYKEGQDHASEEVSTLLGEEIVRAISLAVQETSYLRRVIPVGVAVGSSLAALRKSFEVAPVNGTSHSKAGMDQFNNSRVQNSVQEVERGIASLSSDKLHQKYGLDKSISRNGESDKSNNVDNGSVMVGAVTAALGASALLARQQDYNGNEISETSSKFLKKEGNHQKPSSLEQEISEKNENNIVTSLAEKALTVAGPVVPTKEDGEVDQERLVAMLAELGQKGGMLRLVGKVALLWGGIRGAMSLTDKLISFLRLAERSLFQRILGFAFMVVILWTPVVVPLLPTIVQSWAAHKSAKIAELACIVGLYASTMVLITLWGKRIRGYENPLEKYGLDFTSSLAIQQFSYGLVGGVLLVISIHSINALIGCVRLPWSLNVSSASGALKLLKVYGQMTILFVQGLVTATGVALVEELLFRSWLPDEIAADLGYHRGIIISGFAFSLSQRSPWAIPGLWLLSLSLAGARQRCQGSLALPIGLRAGIMASSVILKNGGFLTYQPNFPLWLTGTNPFQPFSGIVGLALALLLTIVLYPTQQSLHGRKLRRTIKE